MSYMRARVAEAVGSVSGGGHKAKSLPPTSTTRESPAGEQQVLASEAGGVIGLLHTFAEQSSAMAWISGPDSLFTLVNKPWLEFRGRTLQQERGTGWWEGVHPEEREQCHTSYLSAFESRQPFQLECRLLRADGRYVWLALNGVPQYLLNGQFLGYAGSARVVRRERLENRAGAPWDPGETATVRRLLAEIAASPQVASPPGNDAAQPVKLSSETLLACLETSPTPHIVLDQAGQVVYANAALRGFAARALGRADIRRDSGSSNVSPDADDTVRAWLDSPSIPDGFDVQVVLQPLPDGGEPFSCFAVLDAGSERRGRFLQSTFVHDILNAASGLEMVGELLEESSLPEEAGEYVRLLQTAIRQLLSAIHQQRVFLDESGFMVRECPARAVLEEVVAAQHGNALRRGCSIEITGSAAEMVTVVTDRTLLIRVMESMLRSAIEACSGGDVVATGYRRTSGQVEFWVHGPGPISAGFRADILQRAVPAKEKATALGMQAVRLLTELYLKGSVLFSSSPEHGTTFSVRFPDASHLR